MFLEMEQSRTYKRDNRTSFWVSIKFNPNSGYVIYVAEYLVDWFAYRFPLFFKSAGCQWLKSSNGKNYINIDPFTSLDLNWEELDRVLKYLGGMCFWPNILKPTCGSASFLDVCIVRDYTSDTDDLSHWTQMGGLFHNAKYEITISKSERDAMVLQLSNAITEMINYTLGISDGLTTSFSQRMAISSMPIDHEKMSNNLDYELCVNVANVLNLPLVIPCIDGSRKRQVKGMAIGEKNSYWEALIRDNCISLGTNNVQGKIVILVDDLYQSGFSMEKTAQFLKSCGANKVYGFACVKAMRDSDNA